MWRASTCLCVCLFGGGGGSGHGAMPRLGRKRVMTAGHSRARKESLSDREGREQA